MGELGNKFHQTTIKIETLKKQQLKRSINVAFQRDYAGHLTLVLLLLLMLLQCYDKF